VTPAVPAELKVALLQFTPSPERAVASAGRLCYAPVSAAELKEAMTDDDVRRLVRGLVRSGHMSALEHASFTFAIDGISRACSHQLVRHRVASYSQQSQRYVRFGSDGAFVMPPSIAASPAAKQVFLEAMENARRSYERLVELGQAEGRKNESVFEDARFVLPNAAETKIVVTMNARELRHFFQVRCCNRAQWEIRALAWEMRGMVKALAPNLFERTGPNCLYDKCREGKMTCGKPYKAEDVDGPAASGSAGGPDVRPGARD
jgi:thymidylate synthase (FAD)